VVCHCAYAAQADVWSWACLASEVLTLQRPYARRLLTPIQVALQVAEGDMKPDIPPDVPDKLTDLLRACFNFDPLHRPSFAIITNMMRSIVAEQFQREKKTNSSWNWFSRNDTQ